MCLIIKPSNIASNLKKVPILANLESKLSINKILIKIKKINKYKEYKKTFSFF